MTATDPGGLGGDETARDCTGGHQNRQGALGTLLEDAPEGLARHTDADGFTESERCPGQDHVDDGTCSGADRAPPQHAGGDEEVDVNALFHLRFLSVCRWDKEIIP